MERKPLQRLEAGLPAAWYHDPRTTSRSWRPSGTGAGGGGTRGGACRDRRLAHGACRHPVDGAGTRRGSDPGVPQHLPAPRLGAVHRGARQLRPQADRLPVHSWTYDLAGQLVATPRRMETPDFRLADFRLYPAAVASWGGSSSSTWRGAMRRPSTSASSSRSSSATGWASSGSASASADVQANWKLLGRTSPSASTARRCIRSCAASSPPIAKPAPGGCAARNRPRKFAKEAQTLTLDGTARLPAIATLTEAERRTIYIPAMLPPSLFLNVQPDYVNAHMMVATGPQSVRITYDWLFEPERLPSAKRICSTTWRSGTSPTGRTRAIANGSRRACTRASSSMATTCRRNSTATASRSGCARA